MFWSNLLLKWIISIKFIVSEEDDIFKIYFLILGCVFRLFADYWEWEKPESVMQFNLVKRRFVTCIEEYLEHLDANLIVAKIEDFKLEAN